MPFTEQLLGKVALITGAASGIGAATARLFADRGATVYCADLNGDGAAATAERIRRHPDQSLVCKLDVTVEAEWEAVYEQIRAARGRIDVVVNSAGVSAASPVVETSLADWRRVFAVNL